MTTTSTLFVPSAGIGTTVPSTGVPSTVSVRSPVRLSVIRYVTPRYTRVTIRSVYSAGRCGSIARPSSVGRTPSRYCDTSTNVHAAVPVSHEFLPSPGVGASGPATIWQ